MLECAYVNAKNATIVVLLTIPVQYALFYTFVWTISCLLLPFFGLLYSFEEKKHLYDKIYCQLMCV